MNNFGNGAPLLTGFDLNAPLPLDHRSVVDTLEELLNLSENNLVCHGQTTYVEETQLFYQYTGNGETGGWEEVCSLEKLKDVIDITKEEITVNMENLEEGLRSKITITAKELESKFSDLSGGDFSSIKQDMNSIRTEVSAMEGRLNSKITQTADTIMLELTNREAGLQSQITATAKELRSEFTDVMGGDYSAIYQDLEGLHAEIEAMNGTLNTKLEVTAQGLQADMKDLESGLRSEIELSAKNLESKFAEIAGGDYSSIYQDMNTIRTEISAMDGRLNSKIEQTATTLRTEISDAQSGLNSQIELTASTLRTEMSNIQSGLESQIEVTAEKLESKFTEIMGGDYSAIYQDLEKIRTEIADVDNKLTTAITQTASSIRAEVTDFKSATESKFTLLSDKIELSVSTMEGKYTTLQQSFENLKIEAGDGKALNSKIEQTAAAIRTEVSNLETNLKSQISQTESDLTFKFKEGYNQGVTKINKDGIIVSHSSLPGTTKMAADGFYVNNGVENVISVTSSGSSFKGKVTMTSGSISGSTVIDGSSLKAGTVKADAIAVGAVTADKIKAGAVTADAIAANAVTADKIKASAVTADKISSGAITTAKLAANAITADKIASKTITADNIASGAITAAKIASDAIDGKAITGGTITGTTINNGSGTFKVDSTGTLTATNATIKGKVTATSGTFTGTVSGSTIKGGTITGTKIIGEGSGNRILINNADYEIQTGGTTKGFIGLRTLDDGFDTARIALSSTGLNKASDNYFVIVPYNGNGYNPQSYDYPYVDIAYRCPQFVDPNVGYGDCSNIKMYADGIMRLSPIQKLQITTNYESGSYASSGERIIAEFRTYKHDLFNMCLNVRALRNDLNSAGLIFSSKRQDGASSNEFIARMHVYENGFRTFAPRQTSDGGAYPHHLGSGDYRWQTVYAVNSLNTSSDITLKENIKYLCETPNSRAIKDEELSIQDMYEFIRDDLYLTSYNWKNDEEKDEKLGFIAQDIVDTKVGEKIIKCNRDMDSTLGYDNGNFEATIAGALKVAIQRIEELEARIQELENK